jgi:hypothetical protein
LTDLQVFELPEMAKIRPVPEAKAKNWTNKRTPVFFEPSIRKATGIGTRNLYNIDDLHWMGLA